MLEQSMVVSRLEPRSRLVFLPVAAVLHAAALTAAMVAAVWNVSLPSTPPPMRELWIPALAVALPPPPPPAPAAAPAARRSEPVERLAPVTTPVETRIEESPAQPAGTVSETGSGSENGRAGGQEGGVPDGVDGSLLLNPVTNIQPVRPVRPGGGVSTPVNLVRIEPTYPELAKKIGARGLVIIECVIARDGSVRDPRIVRGAHPLLDKAALEAVRQWRFSPGRMGERPVDVLFTLTVRFELAGR